MQDLTTINIPNQCRSLFCLFTSFADELCGKPYAQGVERVEVEAGYVLYSGKSALLMPHKTLEAMKALSDERIALLCRTAGHVLMACFAGARHDYLESRLAKGELLAMRINGANELTTSKRLAHLMGMDADNADKLALIRQAITLLNQVVFKFKIGGKTYECDGLVKLTGGMKLQTSEMVEGLRGGDYAVIQINPVLFDLALKKFTQVPLSLIRNGHTRAALLGFTLLCEQSYKLVPLGGRVLYKAWRLFRDAGLLQTRRPGDARELKYVEKAATLLKSLGLIQDYEVVMHKGAKVLEFIMCTAQTARKKPSQAKQADQEQGFHKTREALHKLFELLTPDQLTQASSVLQLEFG